MAAAHIANVEPEWVPRQGPIPVVALSVPEWISGRSRLTLAPFGLRSLENRPLPHERNQTADADEFTTLVVELQRPLFAYILALHPEASEAEEILQNTNMKLLAERAQAKGISRVVFDRGGFKYHGRVRAFAEGAREGGLEF